MQDGPGKFCDDYCRVTSIRRAGLLGVCKKESLLRLMDTSLGQQAPIPRFAHLSPAFVREVRALLAKHPYDDATAFDEVLCDGKREGIVRLTAAAAERDLSRAEGGDRGLPRRAARGR